MPRKGSCPSCSLSLSTLVQRTAKAAQAARPDACPQAEQKAKRRALPHSVTLCVFYGRCLFQLFYAPIAVHQVS